MSRSGKSVRPTVIAEAFRRAYLETLPPAFRAVWDAEQAFKLFEFLRQDPCNQNLSDEELNRRLGRYYEDYLAKARMAIMQPTPRISDQ